jgi:hypothetical protein
MSSSSSAPTMLRDPAAGGARGIGVHIRTALTRGRLTASLAAGEDASASPELALRARQLTTTRNRSSIALSLERAVADAEAPRSSRSSAAPLARPDVRAARAALRDLAGALRNQHEVSPRGVALTEMLLTDGSGPLYVERTTDALWRAVIEATDALRV